MEIKALEFTMAILMKEQTKDLSICCVCYDAFNNKKLKQAVSLNLFAHLLSEMHKGK